MYQLFVYTVTLLVFFDSCLPIVANDCEDVGARDMRTKVKDCGKPGKCTFGSLDLKSENGKENKNTNKYYTSYECIGTITIDKTNYEIYLAEIKDVGEMALYHNGHRIIGSVDMSKTFHSMKSARCKDIRKCSGEWQLKSLDHTNPEWISEKIAVNGNGGEGLKTGAIIGIVVGVILFIIIVLVVIVVIRKRRTHREHIEMTIGSRM